MPKKTYAVLSNVTPEAVVVYCSDPRFQSAFMKFIKKELKLPDGRYIPFVVAGGGGPLARPKRRKEFKFMKSRLDLFVGKFRFIHRIIIIGHQDCAYYTELGKKVLGKVRRDQHLARRDMRNIANVFRKVLNFQVRIEMFYARFTNKQRTLVTFDQVKLPVAK